jgi:hypothetical protein
MSFLTTHSAAERRLYGEFQSYKRAEKASAAIVVDKTAIVYSI